MWMVTIKNSLSGIYFFLSNASEFLEILGRLDVSVNETYKTLTSLEWKLKRTYQNDNGQHVPFPSKEKVENVKTPGHNQELITKENANSNMSLVFAKERWFRLAVIDGGHYISPKFKGIKSKETIKC